MPSPCLGGGDARCRGQSQDGAAGTTRALLTSTHPRHAGHAPASAPPGHHGSRAGSSARAPCHRGMAPATYS